jgi:hypothetical protein
MAVKSIPVLLLVFFTLTTSQAQTPQSSPRNTSLTGLYRTRDPQIRNTLEVLELANGKIKFHLLALWISPYNRQNVHNGELQAIVTVSRGIAVYTSENCKVTIRFLSDKAIVTQPQELGDCDFGANVTATGSYRKLNSRRPKFDF